MLKRLASLGILVLILILSSKVMLAYNLNELEKEKFLLLVYNRYKFEVWAIAGAIFLLSLIIIILVFSIVKRREAEKKLKSSQKRLKLALWGTNQGLWDWNIKTDKIYINDQWANMLGYKTTELAGRFRYLQHLFHPDDIKRVKDAMDRHLAGKTSIYEVECRLYTKSKQWKWILTRGKVVSRDKDGQPIRMIGTHQDIDKRKQVEEEIRYLNCHDCLTGLYNRSGYQKKLSQLDNRNNLPLSIIMGDVNGLKIINDMFGHDKGDKLLEEIARILEKITRDQNDIVARWGGDEFGIILPNTNHQQANKIIARINEECAESKFSPLKPRIALGVATKKDFNQKLDDIINEAEGKMYQDKLNCKQHVECNMLKSLEQELLNKADEIGLKVARIKKLAIEFGPKLDLSVDQLKQLKLLVRFRDIGLLAIEDEILDKNKEDLTPKEEKRVQEHPEIGYRLAKNFPDLTPIANSILFHHEYWDGSGYPQQLEGQEIPLLSRVLAILEVYEKVLNKDSASYKKVIKELKKRAGTQFDPKLVKIFIEMLTS
ncbi:PAS domain S-box/diguanylate cyclase (GGDEF) domain-containing protein [Halobacteroides halobius DSM 5150]|uniref:PAS domain S-box/diguanylate cyclase (GGDEF) domain-containing protein n=1 Tax=Halobacteroides halobius (strain ATCC 35273 / DSM 5150 / MD-1) TaxID=748449 RepID=L0KBH3_HALHC|nr:diguanylate cyclase [Halobacteroides halobius]AGB41438.1 PAS domain S-box/diguanylate cyclase (GGDEF) domain-containing protein [Halobacteroides halobius DSM 5150]